MLRDWLACNPGAKVRLLGVGGSELTHAAQPDLFAVEELDTAVDRTVDEIRDRFGSKLLSRARTLDRR